MSDILPGCFALGGCQPQFCTSLQAQFDVVWITFRHTHTPSLAFIQGSNAGHPLCSEGGIWQGPNTPGKKSPSLSSPSCSWWLHRCTENSLCFIPKHLLYELIAAHISVCIHLNYITGEQQLHRNGPKSHLNAPQNVSKSLTPRSEDRLCRADWSAD